MYSKLLNIKSIHSLLEYPMLCLAKHCFTAQQYYMSSILFFAVSTHGGVMEHIIIEGEEEAYQSEIQYQNAQSEFKQFIKSAEGWRKLEFISSILGMIALMALIIIAIFRSRIVESIILGSAVMDEYKFVNPSAPPACVKAFYLPPAYLVQIQFQPPTLPQNWGDKGAEGKQKLAAQMTAWITMILIVIALLAILYTIFKKCHYVSSLPRVCFPLYPFSMIL